MPGRTFPIGNIYGHRRLPDREYLRLTVPSNGLRFYRRSTGCALRKARIASLVQAQLAQSVAPTVLVGKELDVVAAVVLGGASLAGGVGTVLGTILGLALLAILQNGLVRSACDTALGACRAPSF